MSEEFYWLKIHEHFFDEDNILYLESLPNGEKYILFWQKLLLKCLKNKDREDKNYSIIRFSDNIPYDPELLSKVTRTDIDTVKVSIDAFKKLGMIEILQDGSIYIEAVHNLIGKRSESADRVKRFRDKKKLLQVTDGNATCNSNKEEEEEERKEKKEIKKKKKKKEENLYFENDLIKTAWEKWIVYKREQYTFTYKSISSEQEGINKLINLCNGHYENAIIIINESISQGWRGLFPLKKDNSKQPEKDNKILAAEMAARQRAAKGIIDTEAVK